MKIFKEEQRFKQTWLIILIAVSTLILIGKEVSVKRLSINELICALLLIVLASSLIFFFKLTTRTDENGIEYRFFPFHFSSKKLLGMLLKKPILENTMPFSNTTDGD